MDCTTEESVFKEAQRALNEAILRESNATKANKAARRRARRAAEKAFNDAEKALNRCRRKAKNVEKQENRQEGRSDRVETKQGGKTERTGIRQSEKTIRQVTKQQEKTTRTLKRQEEKTARAPYNAQVLGAGMALASQMSQDAVNFMDELASGMSGTGVDEGTYSSTGTDFTGGYSDDYEDDTSVEETDGPNPLLIGGALAGAAILGFVLLKR